MLEIYVQINKESGKVYGYFINNESNTLKSIGLPRSFRTYKENMHPFLRYDVYINNWVIDQNNQAQYIPESEYLPLQMGISENDLTSLANRIADLNIALNNTEIQLKTLDELSIKIQLHEKMKLTV